MRLWDLMKFKSSSSYLHSFGFDYNNDGYEDFVYVDTKYDTDFTDAGGVFLFLGPFESNIDFNNIADEADLVFTIEAPQTNIHTLHTKNIDSDVFDEIVVVSNIGIYVIDDNLIGTGVLTNNPDEFVVPKNQRILFTRLNTNLILTELSHTKRYLVTSIMMEKKTSFLLFHRLTRMDRSP